MFNDTLLEEYMATFYGYGTYTGRCWFVGMYGFNKWYKQWWHSVAGVNFNQVETGHGLFYLGCDNSTLFTIVKHPASRGISNDYYCQVGKYMAQSLQSGDVTQAH